MRPVRHRLILQLIATHVSDSEMPMLLYPKTALGTLKALLLKAREPKRGGLVRNSEGGREKGEGGRMEEGGWRKEGGWREAGGGRMEEGGREGGREEGERLLLQGQLLKHRMMFGL